MKNKKAPRTVAVKTLRDVYVRAHTVLEPASNKKKLRRAGLNKKNRDESKPVEQWPERALIFDPECRTRMDGKFNYQSLTFGCFRVCRSVDGDYRCEREGILYSGESDSKGLPRRSQSAVLDKGELNAIGSYVAETIPGIETSGPPVTKLEVHQSFEAFIQKLFWPAVRQGWLVVCFNSPFDISRLSRSFRPLTDRDGFSLIMGHRYWRKARKWIADPYRPTIRIRPKDARVAFIERSIPRFKSKGRSRSGSWDDWSRPARFMDVGTLLKALFDRHKGLDAWCEHFKIPGKLKTPDGRPYVPSGRVTREELAYCANDVFCTQALLSIAKKEFDRHHLALLPDKAYSSASIGKAYLRAFGLKRPPKLTNKDAGIAMQAYQGGRSECKIRCTKVPVLRLDFVSQYLTVNALLKNQQILLADSVEFKDATDEISCLLTEVTLEKCFDQKFWPSLNFFAEVVPEHDIFPTQAAFDPNNRDKHNIADCYLSSEVSMYKTGPDIVASIIRTGKIPQIKKALRVVAKGVQKELKPAKLMNEVEFDPYNSQHDFFKMVVEAKERASAAAKEAKSRGDKLAENREKALKDGLKTVATSTGYGIYVQLIEEKVQLRQWNKKIKKMISLPPRNLSVYSGNDQRVINSVREYEKSGPYYCPPIASLITGGSRLLLAMVEQCVAEAGGVHAACDTDSLFIVANKSGKPIVGNDSFRPDGLEIGDPKQAARESARIPALTRSRVVDISRLFEQLNPYTFDGTILKIEDINHERGDSSLPLRTVWCYCVSAKRYVLWTYEKGEIKIVDAKAHGLGAFMSPVEPPKDWDEKWPFWVDQAWRYVLSQQRITHDHYQPEWLDRPLMQSVTVTTPHTLGVRLQNFCKPYDFVICPVLDSDSDTLSDSDEPKQKPSLVGRFTKDPKEWLTQEYRDTRTGKIFHITTTNEPGKLQARTYREFLNRYAFHSESKALAPGGVNRCDGYTRGVLVRDHVVARNLVLCGKQSDPSQYEGATRHHDGQHFKPRTFTDTNKEEKLVALLPSEKVQLRTIGSKRFRNMGFSPKTYYSALNEGIRPRTHRKILAAIRKHEKEVA